MWICKSYDNETSLQVSCLLLLWHSWTLTTGIVLCCLQRLYSIVCAIPKESLAKRSFGMTMTKILRTVLVWHSSYFIVSVIPKAKSTFGMIMKEIFRPVFLHAAAHIIYLHSWHLWHSLSAWCDKYTDDMERQAQETSLILHGNQSRVWHFYLYIMYVSQNKQWL